MNATSEAADTSVVVLRLYVAVQSPRSVHAIENLRRVCDDFLPGRHEIVVVDLLGDPAAARRDGIVAVPTLPAPVRKIIGDLSDTAKVLVGLQLDPSGGAS